MRAGKVFATSAALYAAATTVEARLNPVSAGKVFATGRCENTCHGTMCGLNPVSAGKVFATLSEITRYDHHPRVSIP